MAEDIIKPKGQLKRSSTFSGGANPRLTPALAVVKSNVDTKRSNQLLVYITDNSGIDPDDSDNWKPVSFSSPFFGSTRPTSGDTGYGDYKHNPSSYGMWMSPPEVGTTVLCMFVGGDMNYGYYIGCVPDPEELRMVPAIGSNFDDEKIIPNEGEAESYGGAKRLPVTNINTNNKSIADGQNFISAPKPVHSYVATTMFQQGILRDRIRGPISSSAQRETPSRVGWGVSTPGRPIYKGGYDDKTIASNLKTNPENLRVISRRAGHSIVMDDGDIIGQDQLIRIRTSLGHQILMSDDGQTLMLLHSNGQSYIELGKEGTVDIYSTNSINLRTQGDLNLHADNNININATKNLNIQGENIHIQSEKEYKQRVGTNYSGYTLGKFTIKVDNAMSMQSTGDISMASDGIAYVNGSKVNLNTGSTSTKPEEVAVIDKILHTDTLFDKQKGFIAAPGKLASITSRAPAHAPWANAGQGVDVKTDLNASSQLPSSPSASVQNTNSVAASTLTNSPSTSVMATAPSAGATSGALNSLSTKSLTGAMGQTLASGPLANAATMGSTIAQTAQGVQAAVGSLGVTARQLDASGFIKPGASSLVSSLAAATGNVSSSMTQNLFTGQAGATNLTSLATNIEAQSKAITNTLQQAQTGLQNSGILKGTEDASQVGGMVLAAAKNGVSSVAQAINLAGSTIPGMSTSGITDNISNVMKDIGAGNFAAASATGSALSGLATSVKATAASISSGLESAKGVTASAFNTIAASFTPLRAGVPQDISGKADDDSASFADSTDKEAGSLINSSTNASFAGSEGTFEEAKFSAISSAGSAGASDVASGLSNLTGGAGAVSAITNLAKTNLPNLPGAGVLTSTIKSVASNAMTGISGNAAGALTSLTGSAVSGAAGALKGLTSGLSSALSVGLPPGLSSQLQGALSSIASAGSGIKLPSIALNTTDRASIESSLKNQLGDAGIPSPVYTTTDKQQETGLVDQNKKEIQNLSDQFEAAKKTVDDAEDAYFKAKVSYPAGDPAIDAAYKAWIAEQKKYGELGKKLAEAQGISVPNFSGLFRI